MLNDRKAKHASVCPEFEDAMGRLTPEQRGTAAYIQREHERVLIGGYKWSDVQATLDWQVEE